MGGNPAPRFFLKGKVMTILTDNIKATTDHQNTHGVLAGDDPLIEVVTQEYQEMPSLVMVDASDPNYLEEMKRLTLLGYTMDYANSYGMITFRKVIK